MGSEPCKVTFQPEGLSVHVLKGTSILEAAGDAGIVVDTPCGGKGTCGKCRIRVVKGTIEPSPGASAVLSDEEIANGLRLACQSKVLSDIVVEIPYSSRFFEQKILSEEEGEAAFEPCIEKKCVQVPEPDLDDIRSDQDRALGALGAPSIPLQAARTLPRMLRENGRRITAVLDCGEIVTIEPGDTSGALLGAAFDVGTTTVVGGLTDLKTGRRLQAASRTNPQVSYGDDVISRIEHASTEEGLRELRGAIVECLNDILGELAEKHGVSPSDIYEVTVAGNTTMTHLFLGIDPTYIAQAPYPSVVDESVRTPVSEVGLSINPKGLVYVLPNVAGFVGSDTVGVVLSTGLFSGDALRLAVDIGTNGEIALGNSKGMLCCSTAAGPAFEGARISQGMRAMPGAIEKVVMGEDVLTNTVGGEPPRGICGSGLIDAVAELLRAGIVDQAGRMLPAGEVPEGVPEAVKRRIVENGGEPAFTLSTEDEGGRVVLTQRDIREVQLAKGAIYAGIETLKEEAGVGYDDISEVLLAGAMANFIRRSNAKRMGLLPDLPTDKIRFVGNAALAGARMALASRSCRLQAEEIGRRARYVELAGRADFQMRYSEAMLFP
jgi:uncharacterized 2Fe-2S/4Fe-4S cluster protein (DUF4445 family)